jgi:hypothetical protein
MRLFFVNSQTKPLFFSLSIDGTGTKGDFAFRTENLCPGVRLTMSLVMGVFTRLKALEM